LDREETVVEPAREGAFVSRIAGGKASLSERPSAKSRDSGRRSQMLRKDRPVIARASSRFFRQDGDFHSSALFTLDAK
jgi:hypothetical protein